MLTSRRTASVRRRVLDWGAAHHRALPWRLTRDPWAVLVSEVMLQQTQAARVVGPYERFIVQFPDPSACAAVPAAEVVRAWDGLGYNRRARYLHQSATAMVARHGGGVPDELEALRALPGLGAYTARAVLAFAFEHHVGVVDTNVARVLARAVAGRPLTAGPTQQLADDLVPPGRSWEWNQAMLDLGATCCTARQPDCARCPIRRLCTWASAGHPDPDPARTTAGTSRSQATFAGSDRQARGRLVAALRQGPVIPGEVAAVMGLADDHERAERLTARLRAEGMARLDRGGRLVLA